MLLFGGALFSIGLESFFSLSTSPKKITASIVASVNEEVHAPPDSFQNVLLTAKSAYVYDISTNKTLFAFHENEKFPLASVTKLMTALVAREHMSESAVVTITGSDVSADGDSGLRIGERWRFEDILDATLLVSSNDGARAIARFVGQQGQERTEAKDAHARFVFLMNEKARALGLTTMEFFNESGLDIQSVSNDSPVSTPETAGGYGSARDVAVLITELWQRYPETLEVTMRKDAQIVSQDNIAHYFPNTNEAVGHFPGLIASKTGYTELAGGNLAMIVDRGIGNPVALVVLGSGHKERFDDMQALVEAMRKVSF